MNVFDLRDTLVADYQRFARSFTTIKADDIREQVEAEYKTGRFWPDPLVQVNPRFEPSGTVDDLASQGRVHPVSPESSDSAMKQALELPVLRCDCIGISVSLSQSRSAMRVSW